ncbi:MAG: hypothetical protein QM793_03460 [Muricomes sp.]
MDRVNREEKRNQLCNCITNCMIPNRMTMENLEEACELVRELYHKNATMRAD